jgi:glycosyltransferase involved in cell wall biosynthesis
MRILHLVETGERAGGVERYLEALLAEQTPGLQHAVITSAGECEWAGRWPSATWPWLAPHGGAGEPPPLPGDVWLMHSVPASAALQKLAASYRVALFVHDHRFWCPSGTRYHAAPARVCTIEAGDGPCMMRYHALRCGSLRPGNTRDGFVRAREGRAALSRVKCVVAASNFMASEARRHGARAVTVVPLPVPQPLVPGAGSPRANTILLVGRLTQLKGVLPLLEAFRHVRSGARLRIAGDGNARGEAEAAVARHPRREAIELMGALGPEQLAAAYQEAAVVVVPSLWPEPFGLVGIEALAAGRPVVTSGRGGVADWAREELGVLTANPDNPQRFAAALDRVLAEPEWLARSGGAGAAWVAERHGMAAHRRALAGALEEA